MSLIHTSYLVYIERKYFNRSSFPKQIENLYLNSSFGILVVSQFKLSIGMSTNWNRAEIFWLVLLYMRHEKKSLFS